MGCLELNNRGVSEVISTVLVLFIITSSMSFVMLWVVPYMDESKAQAQADNVYSQLFIFDEVISTLINQGVNSSSSSNVMIESGNFYIDPLGSRLVIYYVVEPTKIGAEYYDFNISGLEYGSEKFFIDLVPMKPPWEFILYLRFTDLLDDTNIPSEEIIDCGERLTYEINPKDYHFEISGAIKIELSFLDDPDFNYGIFGYIWIFDLGSIKYSLSSSSGEHKVIVENGGILTDHGSGFYLEKRPYKFICNKNDLCFINIAQFFLGDGYSGASGNSVLKIEAKNNNTNILQFKTETKNYVKMCFYGDTSQAWSDSLYLWESYGKWQNPISGDDILYISGNKTLSLIQNVFNVSIGVI